MATALTLIMMAAVASVFGTMGASVSGARSTLEMTDALRGTANRLKTDLEGVTVTMLPPRRPEDGEGYFEYTEGPMGPVVTPGWVARNLDLSPSPAPVPGDPIPYQQDTAAGDTDDMLMFTTRVQKDVLGRSHGDLFVGRYGAGTLESRDAEVAWFVRGRTLYRRVLLVRPDAGVNGTDAAGFYANYDISVRAYWDTSVIPNRWSVTANSLGDLTMPENRFAHQSGAYPYHPHQVAGWAASGTPANALARLNLPLLQECSDATWVAGGPLAANAGTLVTVGLNTIVQNTSNLNAPPPFDAWINPHPWEPASGTIPIVDKAILKTGVLTKPDNSVPLKWVPLGTRFGEDVILNNVIGFDVKAWDPGAPVILVTRTRPPATGVTEQYVVVPGDQPLLPTSDNPNAPLYTGYAQALARRGTAPTDLSATPPIAYTYTVVTYGAYADLGYAPGYAPPFGAPQPLFNKNNNDDTGNGPRSNLLRVYDTWSLHYEHDGVKQKTWDTSGLPTDAGTNGFDDNGDGVVDDILEMETQAPYPVPLRGIQIKIRVFEPDSRQIREVTVVQDFLGK